VLTAAAKQMQVQQEEYQRLISRHRLTFRDTPPFDWFDTFVGIATVTVAVLVSLAILIAIECARARDRNRRRNGNGAENDERLRPPDVSDDLSGWRALVPNLVAAATAAAMTVASADPRHEPLPSFVGTRVPPPPPPPSRPPPVSTVQDSGSASARPRVRHQQPPRRNAGRVGRNASDISGGGESKTADASEVATAAGAQHALAKKCVVCMDRDAICVGVAAETQPRRSASDDGGGDDGGDDGGGGDGGGDDEGDSGGGGSDDHGRDVSTQEGKKATTEAAMLRRSCGHVATCVECSRTLAEQADAARVLAKCPMCRASLSQLLRCY
jgi:uncharacterized membrane protein YgcG